jgi:hypothetical protein
MDRTDLPSSARDIVEDLERRVARGEEAISAGKPLGVPAGDGTDAVPGRP